MCVCDLSRYAHPAIVCKIHHQKCIRGKCPNAINQIYMMGAVMLVLVAVHTLCEMFVDYQGHMMGAKMESDMRS